MIYGFLTQLTYNFLLPGDGSTDKIARDIASQEAILYFEKNPPQFVQKMKIKRKF